VSAPADLYDLVDRFGAFRDAFLSGKPDETRLRREFVGPFFKLLGWELEGAQTSTETDNGVRQRTTPPAYALRIGRRLRFFIETRSPQADLSHNSECAYQLRRYAWSAKLPLSILTSFEELRVYDTRVKPVRTDSASTACALRFRYDEYPKRWGEIAAVLCRDAVLEGSFSKYAESTNGRRGAIEVGDALLSEIEQWRKDLARSLASRNENLDVDSLNTALQRTIDRIMFLRICEDRGIEPYGQLRAALDGDGVYARLGELFRRADDRYNSGLFHFRSEDGRGEPDEFTLSLALEDSVLRDIIERLYYPESPYEFSVLSADILGQVYEQFLGKAIHLTPEHRAEVEEKPEVRKVGGVYYTPTHIVDYIVEHTVGVLLTEAGNPARAKSVTVLDPACGSGSFLIHAYQRLLDWHLEFYLEDGPEDHSKGRTPRLHQASDGEWRLTTAEKKRILMNSVFGVDIDPHAVEVTKLSLLLKVLEGESAESLEFQLQLFRERALPDLAHNIKCGDSLVGQDFHTGRQMTMLGGDAAAHVRAFDWQAEFRDILESGGFAAVIGNPPYLSFSGRHAVPLDPEIREYFQKHYPGTGWQTAHGLFIIKGHDLCSRQVGMIVPDQVGHLQGYESLRSAVIERSSLVRVRYWGENVFRGVTTPALTFITDKRHVGRACIEADDDTTTLCDLASATAAWVPTSPHSELLEKLADSAAPLSSAFADPGVHTGNCSKRLVVPLADVDDDCVPVLEGKQVDRYVCREPTKALRLSYQRQDGEYFTIRPVDRYRNAPFVVRQTAAYPIVGPRRHADYFRNSLLALYPPDDDRDVRFVVAILNSRLMRYVYSVTVKEASQRAFPQVKVRSLRELPIRAIDMDDDEQRHLHDALVRLVDSMLEFQARLVDSPECGDRESLAHRIHTIDAEINQTVEQLYGLSEPEVAQIEDYLSTLG